MRLTYVQVMHLLECVKRAHSIRTGYSDNLAIGALQAHLSILLQLAAERGDPTGPLIPFPDGTTTS